MTVKDHDHNFRKEHVGPVRADPSNPEVEIWVACADPECDGYWTGVAELIPEVDQ